MAPNAAITLPIFALALAAALPGQAAAVDLHADLTSAIALLGLPCGTVLEAKPVTGGAQLVLCSDGHRYRVFVSAEGRFVAQPR